MKILHVVHAYPPSIGGCQLLVERLSRELVQRLDDQVTVFTTVARNTEHFVADDGLALPAGTREEHGVVVRRFPVFNRLTRQRMLLASLSYRWKLPFNELFRTLLNGPIVPGLSRAVARCGADVVLASAFPLLHMYSTIRGARRARIPLVLLGALHVQDTWNYDREMIFRAIRRADAYVALTAFERDHVVQHGAEPQRVHVVGGGVDLARFEGASGDEIRRRLGLQNEPLVIMLAKHVARKRFDVLLEAMPMVWTSQPDTHLVIAGGTTPYTTKIEAMVAALEPRWHAKVHLVSDFDEDEKPKLLAASDLLVLPSARDSFGLVFPEAWSLRKPVIGIRCESISSVVSHEEDGLLVPYDDAGSLGNAILRLVQDPALRRALGDRGHEKVRQNYSWEVVTRRMRSVYRAVQADTAAADGIG